MKRWIPLLCVLLVASAAMAERAKPWRNVKYWSTVFDDPSRDEWQKPLTLLQFLTVSRGDTVADVGAGTGYFTKTLSIKVGPEGRVYAVDVERAMLKHLMAREDLVTERVVPVRARPDDPGLPDGEIDLVVIMDTWHHISERVAYLERLEKSLTPEGRVAIIDYREGEIPVGPPPEERLARKQVVSEFEQAGWRFTAESVALPYQYVLVFLPPEKSDTRRFLTD